MEKFSLKVVLNTDPHRKNLYSTYKGFNEPLTHFLFQDHTSVWVTDTASLVYRTLLYYHSFIFMVQFNQVPSSGTEGE